MLIPPRLARCRQMVCRQSIKTIFEIVLSKKLKRKFSCYKHSVLCPSWCTRPVSTCSRVPVALRRCVYAYHIMKEDASSDELWAAVLPPKPCLREPKVINFDLVKIMTKETFMRFFGEILTDCLQRLWMMLHTQHSIHNMYFSSFYFWIY